MSNTITIVVSRAETEHVFLQRVVQAAIRAYRDDLLQSHEVTDTANEDRNGEFSGRCISTLQ